MEVVECIRKEQREVLVPPSRVLDIWCYTPELLLELEIVPILSTGRQLADCIGGGDQLISMPPRDLNRLLDSDVLRPAPGPGSGPRTGFRAPEDAELQRASPTLLPKISGKSSSFLNSSQ